MVEIGSRNNSAFDIAISDNAADAVGAEENVFSGGNDAKANFDAIYNAPDPRAYYQALGRLDYQIPTEARPIFDRVINLVGAAHPTIIDVGCSYGVNAAMLRHDMVFEDLVKRYTDEELAAKSVAETIMEDARDFAALPRRTDAAFVGVDVAEEAVGYARAVGLIDEAIVANLETDPLPAGDARAVASADLIITTGAIGYVTERTFCALLDAMDKPSWIAAFTLRQFPFEPIARAIESFGLVTEKLEEAVFPQRAFADEQEARGAVDAVRAAGRDPSGLETEGRYYAEFFLARPAGGDIAPISELGLIGA